MECERKIRWMKNRGKLIVLSGPSGVGKGTVVKRILKECDDIALSVSATTRTPREEDTDGVTYSFKTRDEFEKMIKADEFLEWAKYNNNYYGTPKAAVEKLLNDGISVILEIEVKGAGSIKERCPEALFIFIAPPSFETLRERLTSRGSESKEEIENRVALAKAEYDARDMYDFVVVNDIIDNTVLEVKKIIEGK